MLTGLPWNLPSVPGICVGPPPNLDGTSSQAHQWGMSLIIIIIIIIIIVIIITNIIDSVCFL